MKKKIYSIALVAMSIATYLGYQASKDLFQNTSSLISENVEALTSMEIIDGYIVVEDKIPCAGSANLLMVHKIYTFCTDCEKHSGQGIEPFGECTIPRFVPIPQK